jgi:hypothetical protein
MQWSTPCWHKLHIRLLYLIFKLERLLSAGSGPLHQTVTSFLSHNTSSPINSSTYRILRTIGRYFFSSSHWLRPIVHIDLYKDEVKKIQFNIELIFANTSIIEYYWFFSDVEHFFPGIAPLVSILLFPNNIKCMLLKKNHRVDRFTI